MSMAVNKTVSLKGHINYYGNAPFEEPAFKTDKGELYTMSVEEGAKFTLNDVLSMQGHYLQLSGIIEEPDISQALGAKGKIVISSYKEVSK